MMSRVLRLFTWISISMLMVTLLQGLALAENLKKIEALSLRELEDYKIAVSTRLNNLPKYNFNRGVGPIGYRSTPHINPKSEEWLAIQWPETKIMDEIILVPNLSVNASGKIQCDGFPTEFKILAGTSPQAGAFHEAGNVIAQFSASEHTLPRLAPLVIPLPPCPARWVKIVASTLSSRSFDGKFTLQFSEILVYSKGENIALRQSVMVPDGPSLETPGWRKEYLLDGSLPYLMNSPSGNTSLAFFGSSVHAPLTLTLDLGTSTSIDEIRLHAIDQSGTFPQAYPGNFAIPSRMAIEGSNSVDFASSNLICDFQQDEQGLNGSIIMLPGDHREYRYVRLSALMPYRKFSPEGPAFVFGFAEIEIYSNLINVGLHKPVTPSFKSISLQRKAASLTDGLNGFGEIIPVRNWLHQLAERHDLEWIEPLVQKELELRYRHQKDVYLWLMILLLGCSFIFVVLLIRQHLNQQKIIFNTRHKIAADLHDELGANLHAIGLLGRSAQMALARPDRLSEIIDKMNHIIGKTSKSAKHCVNILENPDLGQNTLNDINNIAHRMSADLQHEIHLEEHGEIASLSQRQQVDLYLFYKETLTNILRHSGATKIRTDLWVKANTLKLSVTDNGKGLPTTPELQVPKSLLRRARLLGGTLKAEAGLDGGTRILLEFRLKSLFYLYAQALWLKLKFLLSKIT